MELYFSIWEFVGLAVISSIAAIGFNAACKFDNYEKFDELDKDAQLDFPKPKLDDRMIFWWLRYYVGPVIGKYWQKPLYRCLICMGSLHSILPTWLYMKYTYFYLPGDFFLAWPIIALATAGINTFITYNYNTK